MESEGPSAVAITRMRPDAVERTVTDTLAELTARLMPETCGTSVSIVVLVGVGVESCVGDRTAFFVTLLSAMSGSRTERWSGLARNHIWPVLLPEEGNRLADQGLCYLLQELVSPFLYLLLNRPPIRKDIGG